MSDGRQSLGDLSEILNDDDNQNVRFRDFLKRKNNRVCRRALKDYEPAHFNFHVELEKIDRLENNDTGDNKKNENKLETNTSVSYKSQIPVKNKENGKEKTNEQNSKDRISSPKDVISPTTAPPSHADIFRRNSQPLKDHSFSRAPSPSVQRSGSKGGGDHLRRLSIKNNKLLKSGRRTLLKEFDNADNTTMSNFVPPVFSTPMSANEQEILSSPPCQSNHDAPSVDILRDVLQRKGSNFLKVLQNTINKISSPQKNCGVVIKKNSKISSTNKCSSTKSNEGCTSSKSCNYSNCNANKVAKLVEVIDPPESEDIFLEHSCHSSQVLNDTNHIVKSLSKSKNNSPLVVVPIYQTFNGIPTSQNDIQNTPQNRTYDTEPKTPTEFPHQGNGSVCEQSMRNDTSVLVSTGRQAVALDEESLKNIITEDEDEDLDSVTAPLNLVSSKKRRKLNDERNRSLSKRLKKSTQRSEVNHLTTEIGPPRAHPLILRRSITRERCKSQRRPLNKPPRTPINGERFAKELTRLTHVEIMDLRKRNSMGDIFPVSPLDSTSSKRKAEEKQILLDEKIEIELQKRNLQENYIYENSMQTGSEMGKSGVTFDQLVPVPTAFRNNKSPDRRSTTIIERLVDVSSLKQRRSRVNESGMPVLLPPDGFLPVKETSKKSIERDSENLEDNVRSSIKECTFLVPEQFSDRLPTSSKNEVSVNPRISQGSPLKNITAHLVNTSGSKESGSIVHFNENNSVFPVPEKFSDREPLPKKNNMYIHPIISERSRTKDITTLPIPEQFSDREPTSKKNDENVNPSISQGSPLKDITEHLVNTSGSKESGSRVNINESNPLLIPPNDYLNDSCSPKNGAPSPILDRRNENSTENEQNPVTEHLSPLPGIIVDAVPTCSEDDDSNIEDSCIRALEQSPSVKRPNERKVVSKMVKDYLAVPKKVHKRRKFNKSKRSLYTKGQSDAETSPNELENTIAGQVQRTTLEETMLSNAKLNLPKSVDTDVKSISPKVVETRNNARSKRIADKVQLKTIEKTGTDFKKPLLPAPKSRNQKKSTVHSSENTSTDCLKSLSSSKNTSNDAGSNIISDEIQRMPMEDTTVFKKPLVPAPKRQRKTKTVSSSKNTSIDAESDSQILRRSKRGHIPLKNTWSASSTDPTPLYEVMLRNLVMKKSSKQRAKDNSKSTKRLPSHASYFSIQENMSLPIACSTANSYSDEKSIQVLGKTKKNSESGKKSSKLFSMLGDTNATASTITPTLQRNRKLSTIEEQTSSSTNHTQKSKDTLQSKKQSRKIPTSTEKKEKKEKKITKKNHGTEFHNVSITESNEDNEFNFDPNITSTPVHELNNIFDQLINASTLLPTQVPTIDPKPLNNVSQKSSAPTDKCKTKKLHVRLKRVHTADDVEETSNKKNKKNPSASTIDASNKTDQQNAQSAVANESTIAHSNHQLLKWLEGISKAPTPSSEKYMFKELHCSVAGNLIFTDLEGVDYAFYDTKNQTDLGYLRFKPMQLKPAKRTKRYNLSFVVLQGSFKVTNGQDIGVFSTGDMFSVKIGTRYCLANLTNGTGLLMVVKSNDNSK